MQNTCVGWGCAFIVVLFCMCFEYKDYGGFYHCWLQMDRPLVYGELVPIGVLTITSLTILEVNNFYSSPFYSFMTGSL